jgi:hypothetical protein
MSAARTKSQTPNVQMPKKSQFKKIIPRSETCRFDIVWDLAFGVCDFAPADHQPASRLKQGAAGAC